MKEKVYRFLQKMTVRGNNTALTRITLIKRSSIVLFAHLAIVIMGTPDQSMNNQLSNAIRFRYSVHENSSHIFSWTKWLRLLQQYSL